MFNITKENIAKNPDNCVNCIKNKVIKGYATCPIAGKFEIYNTEDHDGKLPKEWKVGKYCPQSDLEYNEPETWLGPDRED